MTGKIIAWLIVFGAAVFFVVKIWRLATGKDEGCDNCRHGPGCCSADAETEEDKAP